MSNLQNTDILERLYEEAYEDIKNNNYLEFDEDGIIFAAQCEAQRKFEELPEPGDYDDLWSIYEPGTRSTLWFSSR